MNESLKAIENARTTRSKGDKIACLVKDIINHVSNKKDSDFNEITDIVVRQLDLLDFHIGARSLCSNIAQLIIHGSTTIRRTMCALLLKSLTTEAARGILLNENYQESRQSQVEQHKQFINQSKIRTAHRKGISVPVMIQPVAQFDFTVPFSNHVNTSNHRKNYSILLNGRNLPLPPPTTKISEKNMTYAVCFILHNSEYRPGKIRNTVVKGSLLKNMPMYLRYWTCTVLYKTYKASLLNFPRMIIGNKSFGTLVSALTCIGTFNQGLSYFYVDHKDTMDELRALTKRLFLLIEEFETDNDLVNSLVKQLD